MDGQLSNLLHNGAEVYGWRQKWNIDKTSNRLEWWNKKKQVNIAEQQNWK